MTALHRYRPPATAGGGTSSGADGAVNFDGATTPVAGATRSGSTYTLTRDVHATTVTIREGVTVALNGFLLLESGNVAASSATGVYGAGTDGALVFDGTNAVAGTTRAGSVYTLTRDLQATTLVVNATVTVVVAGYRIFASTSFTNNGTIRAAVNPGLGAGTTLGSTYGYGYNGGTGGTFNGGNGGNGGGVAGSGWILGGNGGTGGAGSAGGAGGTPGTNTNGVAPIAPDVWHFIIGGAGGSGGGGGGTPTSGAGGIGGTGGGALLLAAPTITNSATGVIEADGFPGQNGFAGGAGRGGGGGGGGGGGVVGFLTDSGTITNNGTVRAAGGAFGTGGSGTLGAGANGVAGSAGQILYMTR